MFEFPSVFKYQKRSFIIGDKMIVENLSNKTKGIQLDGKWHTVVGNAEKYISSIQKGDDIEVKLNEKDQIVFIKKVGGNQPTEPTSDRFSPIGDLYAKVEELGNAIIEQQAVLGLAMKNNNDLLMKLAMKLGVNIDEIKTADDL